MGLSWINPLYLSGVLLLAIPVIIHLMQKQRAEGIKFPSLMFLQQITLDEKTPARNQALVVDVTALPAVVIYRAGIRPGHFYSRLLSLAICNSAVAIALSSSIAPIACNLAIVGGRRRI